MSTTTNAAGGGAWTPLRTADGSWTLCHPDHGEACHSRAGAWMEARERYALPCRLRERALAGARTLSVLDVGTGLGWNIAAALEALEGTETQLEVVTLESDPSVIEAMLVAQADRARLGAEGETPGERHHRVVRGALACASEKGDGTSPLARRGRLQLIIGDARETIRGLPDAHLFDAVFLDPFSPGKAPALWEEPFLADVAARLRATGWLSTYSAAFRVRLALARAGLVVGRGPAVGTKAEGTLARPAGALPELPERVQKRLELALGADSSSSEGLF